MTAHHQAAATDVPLARSLASAVDAWRHLTPRLWVIPAVIGLVWSLGNTFGWLIGGGTDNLLGTGAHFLYESAIPMVLLVLGLALAEAGDGPPKAMPYAVAAVVAAVLGEALFTLTAPWLGVYQCHCNVDRWPEASRIANMLPDGILICGFIAAGYYFRRRGAQRAATLHATRLEGARLTRQTLESKLQAMQARVEPELLFDTLVEVQRLYDTDVRRADRILDQLIVYLRSALPQLRDATSSLGKELDLAQAYLALLKMRHGERLTFAIATPPDARTMPFAPMVILPLIEHAVAAAPGSGERAGKVEIDATLAARKLRLDVRSERRHAANGDGNAILDAILDGVRARLASLYGSRAHLDVRDDGNRTSVVVEIDVEPTHRDHR